MKELFGLIINIVSSVLYDQGVAKFNKFRFWVFKRNLKKYLYEYEKMHDGEFVTTPRFYYFFENYKITDFAIDVILNIHSSKVSIDDFLDESLSKLRDTSEISAKDELSAKEFLKVIYEKLENYFSSKLSDSEMYCLKTNRADHKKISEQISAVQDSEEVIKKMISDKDKIKDSRIIYSIFNSIKQDILNGNLDNVKNMLHLLKDKNDDLENGIRIILSVLSSYAVLEENIIETFGKIKDKDISNEVARILLLKNFDDKKILSNIKKLCQNEQLCEIIECVISDKTDNFYSLTLVRDNHYDIYNITLSNHFFNEKWLINRIVLSYLLKSKFPHLNEETLKELVSDGKTFVDDLLFYSLKENRFFIESVGKCVFESDGIIALKEHLEKNSYKYENAHDEYKNKFYEILTCLDQQIRFSMDEFDLGSIPKIIGSNEKVKSYIMLNQVLHKTADWEKVLKFAIKEEKYWLINIYFFVNQVSNEDIINILSNNKILIDNDIVLFLIYIELLQMNGSKDEYDRCISEYEDKYGQNLEFHLEKYSNDKSNGILNEIIDRWNKDELRFSFSRTLLRFAEILLTNGFYTLSDSVIDCFHRLENKNSTSIAIKGESLRLQNKELEALEYFTNNFEYCKNDTYFIVERIIMLSRNNLRPIPQEIFDIATKSQNASLLMQCAVEYLSNHDYHNARLYSIKSLLTTKTENDLFGLYIGIYNKTKTTDSPNSEFSDVDTVVYLSNDKENKQKVVCIYKDKILPEHPLYWESAEHIYEDEAISLGLMRKKCGDSISIDNIDYTICDILTLDCYLFRLCMDKMVESGAAKQFCVEKSDNGIENMEDFKKWIVDNTGNDDNIQNLINSYNDLKSTPLPAFLIQKYTRLNYLQVLLSLIEDQKTTFREFVVENNTVENIPKGFALSFSAIIALYKLGIDPSSLTNVVIPTSSYTQICHDADDMIAENKREHAAVLGAFQNDVFIHEFSENEKQEQMKQATEIKRFIEKLTRVTNTKDFKIRAYDDNTLKEILGVCDCDALSIASATQRILVTAEVVTMSITLYEDANIVAEGILDFLCDIEIPCIELLKVMNNMTSFRFLSVLSLKAYCYLAKCYNELAEKDQVQFLNLWNEFLNSINRENDGDYFEVFKLMITKTYSEIIPSENQYISSDIYAPLAIKCFELNEIRLGWVRDELGTLHLRAFKQPAEDNN